MLTSGDVLDIDFGTPVGREAGFSHPTVLITAQTTLARSPSVVHVLPLTPTSRGFTSEALIEPGLHNGLEDISRPGANRLGRSHPLAPVASGAM